MLDLNKEMMIDKMKNYPYSKREGTLKTEGIMQIFIILLISRLVFIFYQFDRSQKKLIRLKWKILENRILIDFVWIFKCENWN